MAQRYTDAIVVYCEGLALFRTACTPRDDVRPGLRVTNYRCRAVIAFEVDESMGRVSILGVFYGGQDYESVLGGDSDQDDPTDPLC